MLGGDILSRRSRRAGKRIMGRQVYSFSACSVTNYRRLSDFRQHPVVSSQMGDSEVQVGTYCFPLGQSFAFFFHSISMKDVITHIEEQTK